MTFKVNNQTITFKRSETDTNCKEEICGAFIEIDNSKISIFIQKNYDRVNWKNVKVFVKELPNQIEELKTKSSINLLYLAKQMDFWCNENLYDTYFELDEIEFFPIGKNNYFKNFEFENCKFHLHFGFEKKDRLEFDTYGNWIFKWQGNHLVGIERVQI